MDESLSEVEWEGESGMESEEITADEDDLEEEEEEEEDEDEVDDVVRKDGTVEFGPV